MHRDDDMAPDRSVCWCRYDTGRRDVITGVVWFRWAAADGGVRACVYIERHRRRAPRFLMGWKWSPTPIAGWIWCPIRFLQIGGSRIWDGRRVSFYKGIEASVRRRSQPAHWAIGAHSCYCSRRPRAPCLCLCLLGYLKHIYILESTSKNAIF
jgi:hypothetical protein